MNHSIPMTDPQRQGIAKALGRVGSGVYILTASHAGNSDAIMASWVQQAGFSPPAVSVALAKGRPIGQSIRLDGRLALSIIPNDDKTLMKHFARIKSGDDPFAGVRTCPAPSGLPVLADALGYLDCRLLQTYDFGGDHELLLAQVIDGQLFREGAAFAHQRGNGFHY